jgi:serine/threonine protein kinase
MIGKRVAVKVLRPDLSSDPGLISRFFQEAKAVNAIRHPNIVDISDFGHTADGIVYFVMEVMEGHSLRDELTSKGPLPLPLAMTVAKQIVDALAAAHRVRIIHRDLKPDNIFLLPDTQIPGEIRAKLFDFGIAKLVGDHHVGHKTIDGAVVGTPFYMSPEQALCQEVGAAADIYAMGVVMYEMLTGTVPFRSEQLVLLLNAILKETPPHARQLRPDIPVWLDRLILHCLEKDPEARPRSMEDIHAQLVKGDMELEKGDSSLGSTLAGPPDLLSPLGEKLTHGRADKDPQRSSKLPQQFTLPVQSLARGFSEEIKHTAVTSPRNLRGQSFRFSSFLNGKSKQILIPSVALLVVVFILGLLVIRSRKSDSPPVPITMIPVPEKPTIIQLRLRSTPTGAEVTRLSDNRTLGTTPLLDSRKPDGHVVSYRFHLAGHTDIQMPFQAEEAGEFELNAVLTPNAKHLESAGSQAVNKGSKARGKSMVAKPILNEPVQVVRPPGPDKPISADQTLPPLGERNPIKRLRH